MTYVKIKGKMLPATIIGNSHDVNWDDRDTKTITVALEYAESISIFINDEPWSIVYQTPSYVNDKGEEITATEKEYDNSDYCVSGPITDNRDGTVSVKMGKKTDGEMLQELKEAINRGV